MLQRYNKFGKNDSFVLSSRRFFIKTPMTDVLPEELKKNYLAQIPAGRFGEPEDIANACVFLASNEASYINGQVLHVNGGMGRF